MSFRPLWIWRLLLLGFAIAYLASAELQAWLPPLLPFVAAAAVEAQFFFAGVRAGRQRRRTRARLFQALAVLALFAGVFLLDSRAAHWQRLSPSARAATVTVLDRQAARIAGHPAEVICDVSGRHVGFVQDADGLAEVGGRRTWLTPQICYQLYLIRRSGRSGGPKSGQAIAVFAHEAWHLRGESSEGIANC